jgi:hypothetical protein
MRDNASITIGYLPLGTQMTATKRKRKRKSRYHTGVHTSPKCLSEIKYRSGWEFEVIKHLDVNPDVVSYSYESIKVPYESNARTKKMRTYYPDFLVAYVDGKIKMIEVKRADKVSQPKTAKKLKAGEAWCKVEGIEFEIWQDEKIKQITEANKLVYPPPPPKAPKRKKQKKVKK